MQKIIEFQEYVAEEGIKLSWENGYDIRCLIKDNAVIISANRQGLISLANHLVTLAQDLVPVGSHLHFDENNSLEDGSTELIISKE
jgi:hypothetical protein